MAAETGIDPREALNRLLVPNALYSTPARTRSRMDHAKAKTITAAANQTGGRLPTRFRPEARSYIQSGAEPDRG